MHETDSNSNSGFSITVCTFYILSGSEISGRHVAKCDYILYKATQTAEVVAISGELASLCAAVREAVSQGAGQIAGRAWS